MSYVFKRNYKSIAFAQYLTELRNRQQQLSARFATESMKRCTKWLFSLDVLNHISSDFPHLSRDSFHLIPPIQGNTHPTSPSHGVLSESFFARKNRKREICTGDRLSHSYEMQLLGYSHAGSSILSLHLLLTEQREP